MIASSWRPNYEAVENGNPRFASETAGNWHINPRFKYKRVWRELVEEGGVGTCDENDTWQEQMANEIVKNRGAIVTGCGGCGKSRILELVKKKFQDLIFIVETCAFTHLSPANADGKTTLRQLHAIAKSKRRVF